MGEFKLIIFIVTNLFGLNFAFLFCMFHGHFFLPFLFFTALFELTMLPLFLFIFSSTDLEVTYSISLLIVVWIVSKA